MVERLLKEYFSDVRLVRYQDELVESELQRMQVCFCVRIRIQKERMKKYSRKKGMVKENGNSSFSRHSWELCGI